MTTVITFQKIDLILNILTDDKFSYLLVLITLGLILFTFLNKKERKVPLLKKTYVLFCFAGILLFLLIFFTSKLNSTIDITVHDTYFIISYITIANTLLFMNDFYALINILIRNYENKTISFIHFLTCTLYFIYFQALFLSINMALSGELKRYYSNSNTSGWLENTLPIFTLIFCLAQLLLFINIMISVYRKIKLSII